MTPRELAAAIRKGAKMHEQCVDGSYFFEGATCAYGAAACGLGATEADEIRELAASLHKTFNECKFREVYGAGIVDANDDGISREQIADWLDTLEPAQRQTFDSFMVATLKAVEIEADSPLLAPHK